MDEPTRRETAERLAAPLDLRAMEDAVLIAWALADAQPPTDPEMGDCVLCNGSRRPITDLANHDGDCTWRLAMEWCEKYALPATLEELRAR